METSLKFTARVCLFIYLFFLMNVKILMLFFLSQGRTIATYNFSLNGVYLVLYVFQLYTLQIFINCLFSVLIICLIKVNIDNFVVLRSCDSDKGQCLHF